MDEPLEIKLDDVTVHLDPGLGPTTYMFALVLAPTNAIEPVINEYISPEV